MDKRLCNPQWKNLTTIEKKSLLQELLLQVRNDFRFIRMDTFSRNGVTTETAVIDYKGTEFVFVPGTENVVLGWDGGWDMDEYLNEEIQDGFDRVLHPLEWYTRQLELAEDGAYKKYLQQNIDALKEEGTNEPNPDMLAFYSFEGLNDYINEHTSPVRTTNIPPMLVEVNNREVGVTYCGRYDLQTAEHTLSEENFGALRHYLEDVGKRKISGTITYSDHCRLEPTGDGNTCDIYRFYPVNRKQLKESLLMEGFVLPTEDTWEYLCGGGTRTLFPFGREFEEAYKYKYYQSGDENIPDDENVLEEPNMFGLVIAYDQYRLEVVDSPCLAKGGDGGESLCGGEDFIYTMLPLSTFWREEGEPGSDPETEELQSEYYYYRRILPL